MVRTSSTLWPYLGKGAQGGGIQRNDCSWATPNLYPTTDHFEECSMGNILLCSKVTIQH